MLMIFLKMKKRKNIIDKNESSVPRQIKKKGFFTKIIDKIKNMFK